MSGALTFEMVQDAMEFLGKNSNIPISLIVSPNTFNMLVESEKRIKWLKTLTPRKRKQEVLKQRIKARRGQKFKDYIYYSEY